MDFVVGCWVYLGLGTLVLCLAGFVASFFSTSWARAFLAWSAFSALPLVGLTILVVVPPRWGGSRTEDCVVIALMYGPSSVLATAALLVMHRKGRSARRRRAHQCTECGYDLWGLIEPRCPECGTPFPKESMYWLPP